ncbi:undecaprenyl-diphosphate phosphatase [Gynurincola endophyticus]|jgi:undecaprenyl-diphosphatase|uniref:undecaprenyl-diphosphate phosphatase n=1 Tax=Gynurincola endophyticus TaxID=2479004 RepID=UPI000F8E9CB6|nr:undecaprenyl-diphosphate phosphatase [Gynurincola endophyticus]
MNFFQAIIIAIIEGLTEFLPISSTGHMIIASTFMGIHEDEFTKLFEVSIQLGAILAVVVLYWKKFFNFTKLDFYFKLIVAVIPALILGFLLSDYIDALLESPLTVSITLFLGGFVLLFIDKLFKEATIEDDQNISYKNAFTIGLWQCLAMIPGMSRSASSIIGGMQQKLTRKLAAEFSFFLAVPTMMAATGYKLLKGYKTFTSEHIQLLLVGNIVAFIVAILAIKFFIGFLQKHGFRLFGWYRIIVGAILLILIFSGVIQH